MVQIGKNQGAFDYQSLVELLSRQNSTLKSTAPLPQTPYQPKGREVYDTVDISGAGKIVNLARGDELAKEIRDEKDLSKVVSMMSEGLTDIKRITRLFQETFKTMYSYFGR